MKPALIIPFKGKAYKSRLSPALDEAQRKRVAHLLLGDVLRAASEAGLISRCLVVSSDPEALMEAESVGASGISEKRNAGVNSAVRLAMRSRPEFDPFLVVPSDLPTLSASELHTAVSLGGRFPLVISPSLAFNGTNLLLFSRGRAPVLSYDDNSFWNHLASAAEKRLPVAVYTGRGVILDLDTASDAKRFLALGLNTATARFLRRALGR